MIEKIGDRIRKLRTNAKLTQKDLAEILDCSTSAIGMYEQNRREPDTESVMRIAVQFGVTTDYLLGHQSEDVSPDNVFPLRTKRIPLLGDIACGEPIFADEQHGNYVITSDNIEADFCLRAKGDSMIGARILDGDIVFIRSQPEVENGQIAAVIIDNDATLKRVYYYPDQQKLVLTPENPAYEPYVYVGSELSQVRILGKAVAFQSVVR